jgi:hypothetical protein
VPHKQHPPSWPKPQQQRRPRIPPLITTEKARQHPPTRCPQYPGTTRQRLLNALPKPMQLSMNNA